MASEPGTPRTLEPADLCRVVRGYTHELRNYLTAVNATVHLLAMRQPPQGDAAGLHEDIHAAIYRIDRLTDVLRTYVLLDQCSPARVETGEQLARAVEAEADAARLRSISLEVEPGAPAQVLVDPAQLEAAVRELIANAIRFSPTGSRVRVACRALEPGLVGIEVEDQGPGISEEFTDQLMRPFFSTLDHCAGLGLKVVARTASLAGGELRWVNLQPTGARFSLVLPRV